MANARTFDAGHASRKATSGWRELWLKEDWWAIWLGLGLVGVSYALFLQAAA